MACGMAGALLCGPLGVAVKAPAAEIKARGLSFPFFAEDGTLTHRVVAKHARIVGPLQHLESVEIVYFAAGDPQRVVQRIIAAEATRDEKKETLVGNGAIVVETEENRLTGEGFTFALASSRLNIERAFTMTNRELVLTSDRAVVDLVLERQADGDEVKLRDVKRCEAFGNLRVKVVQPSAVKKYGFNEATSDRAIYDGATHAIMIPTETRILKNGGVSTVTHVDAISLDPKSRPAVKLK
jgi:hypothetical protein